MDITASMVKELRDKTGAGMMDAKKALVEAGGNMEQAIEHLRQKGIASADKKMNRIAAEGLVDVVIEDKVGAIVEVNCETDFVAKNDDFKALVQDVAKVVIKENPTDVDALLKANINGQTVEEYVKSKIATIGEKITIRRFVRYEVPCCVNSYVHNGKIAVMLETKCKEGSDKAENTSIAKDICLHITSCSPEFISRAEIPSSVIEEETRIEMGKEDLANKPENIRAKIVEGRVNKLMAQRCLLEQPFVKSPDLTIEKLIEGKLDIVRYERFVLGEGLEKRQENFADEVMKQIGG